MIRTLHLWVEGPFVRYAKGSPFYYLSTRSIDRGSQLTFLRVLIVTEDIPYPSLGGLAKHAMTLARALISAGHQVDVLGGDQHPLEVAGEEGEFAGHFFGELHGHLSGWGERRLGMFVLPRKRWIAQKFAQRIMARASDYDVIHYHGHFPNVGKYIPRHVNFVQTRHDQGGRLHH